MSYLVLEWRVSISEPTAERTTFHTEGLHVAKVLHFSWRVFQEAIIICICYFPLPYTCYQFSLKPNSEMLEYSYYHLSIIDCLGHMQPRQCTLLTIHIQRVTVRGKSLIYQGSLKYPVQYRGFNFSFFKKIYQIGLNEISNRIVI